MNRADLDAELLAALFPSIVDAAKVTPEAFKRELEAAGIGCFVSCGRLKLKGGHPQERERLYVLLHGSTDLEARIILRIAMNDPDLMCEIEERACIRRAEGYPDSLYSAVMCNIKPVDETRSYNDKPDERAAEFMRGMGIPEAQIMNREKSPSVWLKPKPKTDWAAELRRYQ